MKKCLLIFVILISISASSQSIEKFMKLQRVFSVDTSGFVNLANYPNPVNIFYSITVPSNVIWIIKNVSYVSKGLTLFEGSTTISMGGLVSTQLGIAINNSPIVSQRVNFDYAGSNNASIGLGNAYIQGPLIISGGKKLNFLVGQFFDSSTRNLNLFYNVEEYIVE